SCARSGSAGDRQGPRASAAPGPCAIRASRRPSRRHGQDPSGRLRPPPAGRESRAGAIHDLQAAAAVGQMGLVHAYETAFEKHGLHTAQVLLTHEDLADRRRYLNARTTLTTLLGLRVIPVINEND